MNPGCPWNRTYSSQNATKGKPFQILYTIPSCPLHGWGYLSRKLSTETPGATSSYWLGGFKASYSYTGPYKPSLSCPLCSSRTASREECSSLPATLRHLRFQSCSHPKVCPPIYCSFPELSGEGGREELFPVVYSILFLIVWFSPHLK